MLKKHTSNITLFNFLLLLMLQETYLFSRLQPLTKGRISKIGSQASAEFNKYLSRLSSKKLNSIIQETTERIKKFNIITPNSQKRNSKYFKAIPAFAALGFASYAMSDKKNNDEDVGNTWNEQEAILAQNAPNRALITHSVYDKSCIDLIKNNGLRSAYSVAEHTLSLPDLQQDQKNFLHHKLEIIDTFDKEHEIKDPKQIFFSPEESFVGKHGDFGMFVNPDKTYVFNMKCKFLNKNYQDFKKPMAEYKKSKILLSTYLKSLDKAKKMQKDFPEKTVLLDPQTTEPFYADSSDPKNIFLSDSYVAEMPFNTPHIPQNFLYFKTKKEYKKPNLAYKDLKTAIQNMHPWELVC